jgi:type I restriction enzyme S subunit
MKTAFAQFVTLQRGFDLPKTNMRDGPYPVVGSTSIIGYHDEYKVEPPGVVTGRSGSLGTVQYIDEPYWPHNTSLWVKDFKGNHPRFVYYCLQALDFARFNAGAGVPTLNRNHLDTLEVDVPSLPMQRRIAGILAAYDDLIDNSQWRIKILEAMTRGLYREWFVEFRFPGHENHPRVASALGEIPKGWAISTLAGLCVRMESGGTPRRSNPAYWEDGDIDWYKTGELRDGFLLDSEEKITSIGQRESNARLFEPGTILMAIYGSPTVGRMGITTRQASCNQAALGLVADTTPICQTSLYFVLLALRDHFNGLAQGAAQQNISKEKVANAVALVPPRHLIENFDRLAAPTFGQIQSLQRKIQNLRRTRDLLLTRLLSRQLEVEVA